MNKDSITATPNSGSGDAAVNVTPAKNEEEAHNTSANIVGENPKRTVAMSQTSGETLILGEIILNSTTYIPTSQIIVLPSDTNFSFKLLPNAGIEGTIDMNYHVGGRPDMGAIVPFGYSGSILSGPKNGYASLNIEIKTPDNVFFSNGEEYNRKMVNFSLAFN